MMKHLDPVPQSIPAPRWMVILSRWIICVPICAALLIYGLLQFDAGKTVPAAFCYAGLCVLSYLIGEKEWNNRIIVETVLLDRRMQKRMERGNE